jgi:hypothetical protein
MANADRRVTSTVCPEHQIIAAAPEAQSPKPVG